MNVRDYPLVVRTIPADEGGGFSVIAPDLVGCMGDGETEAEAIEDCRAAIVEWIAEAQRLGREVPSPGDTAREDREERKQIAQVITAQKDLLTRQQGDLEASRKKFEKLSADIEHIRDRVERIAEERAESDSPWPVLDVEKALVPFLRDRSKTFVI